MRWLNWLPWRFVVSSLARSRGFIDPIAVLSRLHRFAQPSEVTEPVELMRAGIILQARGLINTRAIQHNLDWVWPYWIERQFNPHDSSFVPRAFSITHVNLTHRNWTAVGLPDCVQMPLVDPRGLVTPLFDGWSLDTWLFPEGQAPLLPSRAANVRQRMSPGAAVAVESHTVRAGLSVETITDVVRHNEKPHCRIRIAVDGMGAGRIAVSLRPANPEGVAFIHDIEASATRHRVLVNGEGEVLLNPAPERILMSHYRRGDVFQDAPTGDDRTRVTCDVGMASAAAIYAAAPAGRTELEVQVPLTGPAQHDPGVSARSPAAERPPTSWETALQADCRCELPDERMQFLFDNAVRNLVLFSPGDVFPGPYTSKRFWFRDAAFILHALLVTGHAERVRRVIERYPRWQQGNGFFRSQEGEWDANGQALWMTDRYRRLTGNHLSDELVHSVAKGVRWIGRKRLRDSLDAPHAGLLPAGFSAEHLGPNDYFYWDDFWSIAGLRAAAELLRDYGHEETAEQAARDAANLSTAIDRSLERSAARRDRRGVPASPYRRMDAGAIGSLAAGYPGQVWEPRDPRLLATAEFLHENCTVRGGFFQDVIHSGVNVYLTLHLAEVFLRAGDARAFELVEALADLASPTGNWPEAIHPNTGGGCMGDGQHIWAAAEWVLMIRNLFVREEREELVLGSGIPEAWLDPGCELRMGPTPTRFGPVTVFVEPRETDVEVRYEADWHTQPSALRIRLPGCQPRTVAPDERVIRLARQRGSAAQPVSEGA